MRDTYSPSESRHAVARAIRIELASRNMSAAELARRTRMDDSYLSRRMTGDQEFTVGELFSVAQELDVPITQLLGEAVPVTAGSGPTHPPTPSVPGPGKAAPERAA